MFLVWLKMNTEESSWLLPNVYLLRTSKLKFPQMSFHRKKRQRSCHGFLVYWDTRNPKTTCQTAIFKTKPEINQHEWNMGQALKRTNLKTAFQKYTPGRPRPHSSNFRSSCGARPRTRHANKRIADLLAPLNVLLRRAILRCLSLCLFLPFQPCSRPCPSLTLSEA